MQFVSIDGTVIHYDLDRGADGRATIVLINSLGTDFRIWDQVRPKLSDFTTLVYDLRGHGLSSLAAPPYTIADHVRDLRGLLDHLDLQQVVLCGLSVGGLIAQGFHQDRPEKVRGLILSNTASKIGTCETWAARIAAIEQHGIAAVLDDIMSRWFTEAFRDPQNAAYQGYRHMLARQPQAGYVGTCAAIRDADFTLDARKIDVPVLCIAGQHDGSTPPELVKAMADMIPGAVFEIIDDAAHIPCVEAPAVHAALIRAFVQTVEKGSR